MNTMWDAFGNAFLVHAHEMDMAASYSPHEDGLGIDITMHNEDNPSEETQAKCRYVGNFQNIALIEVNWGDGESCLVSTPHAAFAVLYV